MSQLFDIEKTSFNGLADKFEMGLLFNPETPKLKPMSTPIILENDLEFQDFSLDFGVHSHVPSIPKESSVQTLRRLAQRRRIIKHNIRHRKLSDQRKLAAAAS